MTAPAAALAPLRRVRAAGRPLLDPGCAGCGHLPLLRAVRRAALAVDGGLGCEPARPADPLAPAEQVVRLAGAVDAVLRAPALLARPRALLAVADRGPQRTAAVCAALAAAGARVVLLPPGAPAGEVERVLASCLADPRAALVSIVACARGRERGAPRAVDPARCNRCGGCLSLGCAAISDPGGEAMAIDGARCSGCGQCAALCRARAIAPLEPPPDAVAGTGPARGGARRKAAY